MSLIRFAESELETMRGQGIYKDERVLTSAQSSQICTSTHQDVLNLCANNYLGLSNHPEIVQAAHDGLDHWGFGLSSVRFICGTQAIHKQLEDQVSRFLGTDDTILYASCFDANGGLYESLLGPEDAIVSDRLNHASIIDGIRLCKAKRYRYANNDMDDLRRQLQQATDEGTRFRMITTDGVFSMDGCLTRLDSICQLADEFDAVVHVDDCHATGFVGETGRGTHEHFGVQDRVDLITSTFGKALGGASGGFTSGRGPLIELLRQRSRPYLFSNSLAPSIVTATLKALEIVQRDASLRDQLRENTGYFRQQLEGLDFEILPGDHPIVPIMMRDASQAVEFANRLLAHRVYVIAFSYPVVPLNQARIRTQLSAGHRRDDLDHALRAMADVRREMVG